MTMKRKYISPAFVVVALSAKATICAASQKNALPDWLIEEEDIFDE